MRSRFTAYALGGYGDYLLNTWFPATAQGLTAEQLSHRELNWQKLEVLSKSQQGDEATVEFKAYYLPKASSSPGDGSPAIGDQHGLMHEVSEFRRVSGRWYYIGGRVM